MFPCPRPVSERDTDDEQRSGPEWHLLVPLNRTRQPGLPGELVLSG